MTSMTRGPLPASVYWRRRVVVIGVALTLLLLIVNVLRGGGGDDSSAGQARTVSGVPTSAPTSAPAVTKSRGQAKSPGTGSTTKRREQVATPSVPQGPAQPTLVAPTGACKDSDVLVTPSVGTSTVDTVVPITLSLRTRTAPACTWHVTAQHLAIQVSRHSNAIWSTSQCPQQVPITDVVVRQAVSATLHLSWSSRRSESGCPRVSPAALPGHYAIAAAAVGGVPAQSGFDLVAGTTTQTAPESPTASPSQTPGDTPTQTSTQTPTQGPSQSPTTGANPTDGATPARR